MAKTINVVYKVDDKALLKAKTEIQGIEKETKDSEKEMLKLDKAVQKVGNDGSKSFLNFKNIIGAISVTAIIAGLTQLGRKILDLGIKQEQLNIAFTTFLGSASKAKALLAELTKFAIVTPFSPEQVNSAARALLAFGVRGKEIIPTLKMLGDVSAGTGKDLTEMAVIFGQIRSTGRLMGQDLLQLINAGFNPLQVISEKTGKSVGALKDEMEKGAISFEMVADAFKTATSEGGLFFNLMEKQSQSVGGKISALGGNFEEMGKKIFAANQGPLSDFLDLLVDITTELAKTKEQSAADFGVNYDVIKKIVGGSDRLLDDLLKKDKFKRYLNDLTSLFNLAVSGIEKFGKEAVSLEFMTEQVRGAAELQGVTITLAQAQETAVRIYEQAIAKHNENVEAINSETTAAILQREAQNKKILSNIEETKRLKELKDSQDEARAAREKDKKAIEDQIRAAEQAKAAREEFEKTRKDKQDPTKFEGGFDSAGALLLASIFVNEEKRTQKEKEESEKRIAQAEEEAKRKQDFAQASQDFVIDSLQQVLYASLLTNQEDFSAQQEKFERELELAGNNEAAKDQIRRRQETEEKAFRERQKKEEKEAAIKKIAIDTAINVIRSIANNGGIPLGLPFGALAAAAGIVQATTVRKLAKGEIGIDGPGTSTSDSIPAMLSKGESVINAGATSKSSMLLEAINDRKIDDRILGGIAARGGSQAVGIDYERLGQEFRKGKVDYDTHGYTIMKGIQKGKNFKQLMRSKAQGY